MPEFDVIGLFVADGISRGRTWGTYRRERNGWLRRVHSRTWLPDRDTQEEAEKDLRAYLSMLAHNGRSRQIRETALAELVKNGWWEERNG